MSEGRVEEEEDLPKFDIVKAELKEWTKIDDTLQTAFVPYEEKMCARIMNHDKEEAQSDDCQLILTCIEMLHAIEIFR